MAAGQALTVFRFHDARGTEGDTGDARRVGGVYGGYGNRLAKVVTGTPGHEALTRAMTEGFRARGIEAVGIADREINPAAPAVQTPLALGGEIRNFSTESRWTQSAHVSGILRLYDLAGACYWSGPSPPGPRSTSSEPACSHKPSRSRPS